MKRHYDNLGLPVGASQAEIKKAYRRLAMKLHPDKNPDPRAADLFAQLQDSYDALMNPQAYQNSGSKANPSSSAQARPKTAKERTEEARQRYEDHMRRQKANDDRYFNGLVTGRKGKIHKIIMYSCLGIAIFLFLDMFLPTHRKTDYVKDYQIGGYQYRQNLHAKIYTMNNGDHVAKDVKYSLLSTHPELYVEKSRLFNIPINIIHPVDGNLNRYTIDSTIWSYVPLLILAFIFPSILLFYREKTAYFTAIYMFSHYAILPAAILFLLADKHWLHLLTLGFA